MRHDNENDPLPFITLGAATLNVLRYLQLDKEKNEDSSNDPKPREAADDYLDQSVARIEEFERRARGIVRHRPRRQRE